MQNSQFCSNSVPDRVLNARELKMRFSPFETFYPRHVQRPITLAMYEICP